MSNAEWGAIPRSLANDVSNMIEKKMGTSSGYKPSEWANEINLMGKLPIKTASGAIASFSDGADDVPISSGTFSFLPTQSGSGTPSPSNPRPIVGYTGMTINQTGKNLLNYSAITLSKQVRGADGAIVNSTASDITDYIRCGGTMTLSFDYVTLTATAQRVIGFYDANKTFLSTQSYYPVSKTATFTAPTGAVYCIITLDKTISDAMLELGSTATTYEAYKAKTPIVDTFGRTVYGGSRSTDGTLTETYRLYTATDVTGLYWNNRKEQQVDTYHRVTFRIAVSSGYITNQNSLCSHLSYNANITGGTGSIEGYQVASTAGIYFCVPLDLIGLSSATSSTENSVFLDAIHALGNTLQFCVELSTPNTYTLDPIAINTYYGANNIFTDVGESSVTYRREDRKSTRLNSSHL